MDYFDEILWFCIRKRPEGDGGLFLIQVINIVCIPEQFLRGLSGI